GRARRAALRSWSRSSVRLPQRDAEVALDLLRLVEHGAVVARGRRDVHRGSVLRDAAVARLCDVDRESALDEELTQFLGVLRVAPAGSAPPARDAHLGALTGAEPVHRGGAAHRE